MEKVLHEKLQHVKTATGEECKTKRVKMQYEIDQFIKRVQHEKSATLKYYYTKKCNMEILQYKKVQHQRSAT